ncbi:MAG: choice-of-anchor Q domain-containing protein [Marinicella sp.]|nr:hypothetical protein [Xanthomonadales bacterium]
MRITQVTVLIATIHFSLITQAATIVVNTSHVENVADDGLCTMYEAMDAVNNNVASGSMPGECIAGEAMPVVDVIEFAPEILPAHFYPFTPFQLSESVHINGVSRDLITFSSQGIGRAFVATLMANASYTINDVTFSENSVAPPFGTSGGAMSIALAAGASFNLERVNFFGNFTVQSGGAIALLGADPTSSNSVTIKDCLFDGNFISSFNEDVIGGGAIFVGAGFNVTISNSAFVDNVVFNPALQQPLSDGAGGAILIRSPSTHIATLEIANTTISNNTTTGVGGGIAVGGPGFPSEFSEVTIKHSTIVNNTADSNSDQPSSDGGGGGIWSGTSTPVNLFNTVVGLNTDNAQIFHRDVSGAFATFGYNFITDNTGSGSVFPVGQPNANDDWVGTTFALLDPGIEAIADNGGPTPTHLPSLNSLLIDQGRCNNQTNDQRYFYNDVSGFREVDVAGINNALTGCDIGAVEYETLSSNFIPVAITNGYDMLEGETLIVSAAEGLLINDTDTGPFIVNSAGLTEVDNGLYTGSALVMVDGSFVFQTDNPDASGQMVFDYEISDQYNTDSASVVIDITPVNDAPTFLAGGLSYLVSQGELVQIPAWATAISAGPTNDETGTQSLQFQINVTDVNFFEILPSVDAASGDLEFKVSDVATGAVEINIALKDNGGTDNGGEDTSEVTTIVVTVDDLIFADGFE